MFRPDSDEEFSNNSNLNHLSDDGNGSSYYLPANESFVLDRSRNEYFENASENFVNVSNFGSKSPFNSSSGNQFELHKKSDLND